MILSSIKCLIICINWDTSYRDVTIEYFTGLIAYTSIKVETYDLENQSESHVFGRVISS